MDDLAGGDLIAPVALAERVADQLRDLVVRGVLAPGQRIVERRLCAELGVSRTPM
ncbi:MAG: GntR family transcriptional regulator, partial [Rhodobacterales bacterium]|nr:GntR family transcriptional regulator [Rhodobacterales bacterium]